VTLGSRTPATLTIVTEQTQAAGDSTAPLRPEHAPAWTLGRTIASEHPELRCRRIDVGARIDVSLLFREIAENSRAGASEAPEVVLRGSDRYVPRLERVDASEADLGVGDPAIRDDGAYLITGGFGGLGQRIGDWLSERGAGTIVVLSRRGANSDDARAAANRWTERGARVEVYEGDVADAKRLREVWNELRRGPHRLRAIIHAAGILDDGVLLQQAPERFAPVMAPKVQGAWNLHRLSLEADGPLDFFVCFSSLASVLGAPGQGNYVAANGFLDGLAHYRRQLGLPATTINWGPWAGPGMARSVNSWQDQGISALVPEKAFELLELAIRLDKPQITIASIDWERLSRKYGAHGFPPLLQSFQPTAARPIDSGRVARGLVDLAVSERRPRLVAHVQSVISEALGFDGGRVLGVDDRLFDAGIDSLMAVQVGDRLARDFGITIPAGLAFNHSTISQIAEFLGGELRLELEARPARRVAGSAAFLRPVREPVAIVGIACRFPGHVTSPDRYWQLLKDEVDAIQVVPPDRWDADEYYDPDPDAPNRTYTRHGGFLDDIDYFDAGFFNISDREAERMDPQQRILLETTWEALENASISAASLAGSRTGVFVGIAGFDNALCLARVEAEAEPYLGTGNALSAAAGRLSYVLGLMGPSLSVDTACSSSLVAVHLACQNLLNSECDVAIAAGVNLMLLPDVTLNLSKARMLAKDGRCKTFDARADGYVRSEGCGVAVLKRLSDALAANDPIWGVVRGSAVNQDGASGGFTVPNGRAQQ